MQQVQKVQQMQINMKTMHIAGLRTSKLNVVSPLVKQRYS